MASDHDEDHELRALYRGLPTQGEHPDEDAWVRLATDAIGGDERMALADHLATCAECVEVFRAVEALKAGRASVSANPSAAGPAELAGAGGTRPLWRRPVSWLAAVATVLVAMTAAVLQERSAQGPASGEPAASTAPALAQAPTVPTLVTPPAAGPRAWASEVQAPAVELPARYALVTRGEGSRQPFLKAFGTAIGSYREGRYAEAARALEAVARDFPDVPEGSFYLGVSRLLSEDPRGAIEPLIRARAAESLGDAARWYEAVAAEQAGDREAANQRLRELCDRSGDFQARACAAVDAAPGR